MKNLKQIEEEFDKIFGVNGRRGKTYLLLDETNVKQFISTQITQLLEELRDEELKRDFKTTSEDRWSAIGYNACAKSINFKINKILNK